MSVIKSEIHFQEHTAELTHKMTQPTEDLILSRNAELRKMPGAMNDLGHGTPDGSWGRQVASIPEIMFHKAIKDGYDLTSTDSHIAQKEMQRFLLSTEGKMCLIQDSTAKSSTKYFKGN